MFNNTVLFTHRTSRQYHRYCSWLLLVVLAMFACKQTESLGSATPQRLPGRSIEPPLFTHPERVTIRGYVGDAMEPFITRDNQYLLFNNSNAISVNTDLMYAERIDDLNFQYKGEIQGVNTAELDAVPSMDLHNNFYFVSTRSYADTRSTIYRGQFAEGVVSDVGLVSRISRNEMGMLDFDAEISPDGATLYFVDGRFGTGSIPEAADIVFAGWNGTGFERLANSALLLERVNTPALEYAPAISADGLELFFTRFDAAHAPQEPVILRAWRNSPDEPFELPAPVTAIVGFVEAPSL
jgi:hypothetical protein